MGTTDFEGFFGIQCRVNAAEHNGCALGIQFPAERVTTQGVPCVHPNADNIARQDLGQINEFEGFVPDYGIAKLLWCRRRQHIEPAWRDDGCPEGHVTRIYKMYADTDSLHS